MDYAVTAPTTSGYLSTMFTGTLSQCRTFIRNRNRWNMPTHFCYICRDTYRAKSNLARRLHVEY